MKRSALIFAILILSFLMLLPRRAFRADPQTHTFCSEDAACTWLAAHTFHNVVTIMGNLIATAGQNRFGAYWINGVPTIDGNHYPLTAAGLNQCIADALKSTPRTCDARSMGGTLTLNQQISVGDSAQDSVTLLIPPYMIWQTSVSDGTSCGLKQYGNSSIVGTATPGSGNSYLEPLNRATSVAYLYCVDPATPGYIKLQGLTIYNPNTVATTSGRGARIHLTFDNSIWRDMVVADYIDTYALEIVGACCSATFDNVTIAGPGFMGGPANAVTPLFIRGSAALADLRFFGSSIDHPGPGKPNILVQSSTLPTVQTIVDFYGLYMEGNIRDASTPFVSITGTQGQTVKVNLDGVTANALSTSSTQPVVSSTSTGVATISTRGVKLIGGFTLPLAAAISDTPVVASVQADSSGNVADYSNIPLESAGVRIIPTIFSALPTCSSGNEGLHRSVSDSTTATPGAAISGSGSNHVAAYCNGKKWIVL